MINYVEVDGREVARVMALIMEATLDEDEDVVNLAMTGLTLLNQNENLSVDDTFKSIKLVTEFTATVAATTNGSIN